MGPGGRGGPSGPHRRRQPRRDAARRRQRDEAIEHRGSQAGLARARRLRGAADAVVVIGDTPRSAVDPPACLSGHAKDALACATEREVAVDEAWLGAEAETAAAEGVAFIDPTDLMCTAATCPAVIGRYLVQRDEHHLATPFAASLAERLAAALPPIR
jgi:hypothetical protein